MTVEWLETESECSVNYILEYKSLSSSRSCCTSHWPK